MPAKVSLCFATTPGTDPGTVIKGVAADLDGTAVQPDGTGWYHLTVANDAQGRFTFLGSVLDVKPAVPVLQAQLILSDQPQDLAMGAQEVDEVLEEPATLAGIQRRLRILGYYDGPVDGAFGGETEHGIIDFQADNALRVTGSPADDAMQKKLREVADTHRIADGAVRYGVRYVAARFQKAFTGWDAAELEPDLDDRGYAPVSTLGQPMPGPAVSVSAGTTFAVALRRLRVGPGVQLAVTSSDAGVVAVQTASVVGAAAERILLSAGELQADSARAVVEVRAGETVVARLFVVVLRPYPVDAAVTRVTIGGTLQFQFPAMSDDGAPDKEGAAAAIPGKWLPALHEGGVDVSGEATCTCVLRRGPKKVWHVADSTVSLLVKTESGLPTVELGGEPVKLTVEQANAVWGDLSLVKEAEKLDKPFPTRAMQRIMAVFTQTGHALEPDATVTLVEPGGKDRPLVWVLASGEKQFTLRAHMVAYGVHGARREGDVALSEAEYARLVRIVNRIWNPAGVRFEFPEAVAKASVDLVVAGSVSLVTPIKTKGGEERLLDGILGNASTEQAEVLSRLGDGSIVKIGLVPMLVGSSAVTITGGQKATHPAIGILLMRRRTIEATAVDVAHELGHYLSDLNAHAEETLSSASLPGGKLEGTPGFFHDISKIRHLMYGDHAWRKRPGDPWAADVGSGPDQYGCLISIRAVDVVEEYGESECAHVRMRLSEGLAYYPHSHPKGK